MAAIACYRGAGGTRGTARCFAPSCRWRDAGSGVVAATRRALRNSAPSWRRCGRISRFSNSKLLIAPTRFGGAEGPRSHGPHSVFQTGAAGRRWRASGRSDCLKLHSLSPQHRLSLEVLHDLILPDAFREIGHPAGDGRNGRRRRDDCIREPGGLGIQRSKLSALGVADSSALGAGRATTSVGEDREAICAFGAPDGKFCGATRPEGGEPGIAGGVCMQHSTVWPKPPRALPPRSGGTSPSGEMGVVNR